LLPLGYRFLLDADGMAAAMTATILKNTAVMMYGMTVVLVVTILKNTAVMMYGYDCGFGCDYFEKHRYEDVWL
jgi:methionine synthase I (cobalamin-dependent)